jgi:hypothetical protein
MYRGFTVVAFRWFRYVKTAQLQTSNWGGVVGDQTVIEQWLHFETTTPQQVGGEE